MPAVATTLPSRRPELLVRPLGNKGQHVVKDPRTGDYYTLGEQESFLLAQLDGQHAAEDVCQAFAERFGEPLSEEDLDQFVRLAQSRGFLEMEPAGGQETAIPEAEGDT